ncbi:hypothetical protein H8B09_26570 [Paenibacillus sp. PR3]|uniref:Lipoprotein n=1 Tax=Paenibacillus terricola TaxID=2763503 RepID=A0ABR8N2F5_9BACL|nr:hypothetical protein [Paenibacillus terricola]MBD3922348.1 hypothetical protein [Paenibacillus terricola]
MRGIHMILVCVLLSSVLWRCSSRESRSIPDGIKQIMSDSSIQYDEIMHIEVYHDGFLAFYRNDSGLNAGFIRNASDGLKWIIGTGGAELDSEIGLSWTASNLVEVPIYFIFGVISDPDIAQVKTNKPDATLEKTAKIVTTNDGTRIWFVLFENPVNAPLDVIGLSKDGKILNEQ